MYFCLNESLIIYILRFILMDQLNPKINLLVENNMTASVFKKTFSVTYPMDFLFSCCRLKSYTRVK